MHSAAVRYECDGTKKPPLGINSGGSDWVLTSLIACERDLAPRRDLGKAQAQAQMQASYENTDQVHGVISGDCCLASSGSSSSRPGIVVLKIAASRPVSHLPI